MPKVGVITRNYVTRNSRDYLRVVKYAHDLLAQRSERLYLIGESRVRASQTGHFGEIWRSLADRPFGAFFARFSQNDLSARLKPGVLRSDTGALTSALASKSG